MSCVGESSITVALPVPRATDSLSVEQAIAQRRSVREYADSALSLAEVGQLLWAAQGITDQAEGLRTAPSAGALYPLEIYLVAGRVSDLTAGVYQYLPKEHKLKLVLTGDQRAALHRATLEQESIKKAPAVIVIAAVYERTRWKYGSRAERYVHVEVGAATQNLYLQCESLDLGTVCIGAFYDERVQRALKLPANEIPLAILPLGRRK